MKRDVGMACKKVHKQGSIKVMVNIQSLIHPYIFSQKSKDVRKRLCYFTITFILLCLCTFWHAIPIPLFIFNDFSFLFLHFFWYCSQLRCLITTLYLETVLTVE